MITVRGLGYCKVWDGPVLHACAEPCWRRRTVGRFADRQVEHDRERMFGAASGDLYWKLVDPRVNAPELLRISEWLDAVKWLEARADENVLVHCNHGRSRAPSLELLVMVRADRLHHVSYSAARFMYDEYLLQNDRPTYDPGDGIKAFLHDTWKVLLHG